MKPTHHSTVVSTAAGIVEFLVGHIHTHNDMSAHTELLFNYLEGYLPYSIHTNIDTSADSR